MTYCCSKVGLSLDRTTCSLATKTPVKHPCSHSPQSEHCMATTPTQGSATGGTNQSAHGGGIIIHNVNLPHHKHKQQSVKASRAHTSFPCHGTLPPPPPASDADIRHGAPQGKGPASTSVYNNPFDWKTHEYRSSWKHAQPQDALNVLDIHGLWLDSIQRLLIIVCTSWKATIHICSWQKAAVVDQKSVISNSQSSEKSTFKNNVNV